MQGAWSKMKHVFSIRRRHDSGSSGRGNNKAHLSSGWESSRRHDSGSSGRGIAEAQLSSGWESGGQPHPLVFETAPDIKKNVLWKHPVDLFVIECCSQTAPPPPDHPEQWERAVSEAKVGVRPKVILECWNVRSNTWSNGPTEKASVTRWQQLGYTTRVKFVRCIDVGGAINQFRLLVARVISSDIHKWVWPQYQETTRARPMADFWKNYVFVKFETKLDFFE